MLTGEVPFVRRASDFTVDAAQLELEKSELEDGLGGGLLLSELRRQSGEQRRGGPIVGWKVRKRIVEVNQEMVASPPDGVRGQVTIVQALQVVAALVAAGEAERKEGPLGRQRDRAG